MAKTIEDVQYSMTIGNEPPSNDTNKVNEPINASISKEPNFNVTQSEIQETAKYIKRGHETGIMNDTTRSSIVIRHNGQINVSSNRYAQYKLNPSGKVIEEALESVSLSNRRKIHTDDLIVNEHKLNPYLYELTDMKKLMTAYNDDMRVGNFCLFGSVLTMSWEMNLKRYVLIRRPARMPMFSPVLNVPEINTGLGITDPLKIDETLLAKSTKGYQVNAVVSDAKSLIGKEGQARFGTNAGNIINYGDSGEQLINGVPSNVANLPDVNVAGANDTVPDGDVPSGIPYGNIANAVAKATVLNIKPRLIWAQMHHETGGWPSGYWGLADHNYAGIKGSGGAVSSEGDTYGHYNSDEDFIQDYAKELRLHDKWQRENYGGTPIGDATTPLQYAAALKASEYYGDPLEVYVNGLVGALRKIPSQ